VSLDPLKCTYLGYYISAVRGCCALKFLHALEIDQALVAQTQRRMGVNQKNFNLENLKFGLKFSVLPLITSGLLGVSPQNFFQSTCCKTGLINWVQFLEGPPPKVCEGEKSSKIFRHFWQLSTLIANISGTDSHIENRKSSLSTTTPPTLAERKTVNFGPQTKKLLRVVYIDHNVLFLGYYISALRGAAPSNFYTRYRLPQAC